MAKTDGNSGTKIVHKSGFAGMKAVGSGKTKSRTLVESRGGMKKQRNPEVDGVVSQIVNMALKNMPHLFDEVKKVVLNNLHLGVAVLWSKLENLVPSDALTKLFDALFTGGLLKQRA